MQEHEFKKWLFSYLIISRKSMPTTELQYKLFFETFVLLSGVTSEEEREVYKEEFDEGIERMTASFQRYLPKSITDEIVDWQGFGVGKIDKAMWLKMKDFYEETFQEKFDISKTEKCEMK